MFRLFFLFLCSFRNVETPINCFSPLSRFWDYHTQEDKAARNIWLGFSLTTLVLFSLAFG